MLPVIGGVAVAATYAWNRYAANTARSELETRMINGLTDAAAAHHATDKIEILRKLVPEAQFGLQNPFVPNDHLSAKVYLALAEAYLSIQNLNKVIETCRKGIQCEHDNAEIKAKLHFHLTHALFEFNQFGEGALVVDAGRKLRPQISPALANSLDVAYAEANLHPQVLPAQQEQTIIDRVLDPVVEFVFPPRKSYIHAAMRLLQASECFKQKFSGLYRDLKVVTSNTKDEMEKCYDLVVGGLRWYELHRSTELNVDLFAMLYFAIYNLTMHHQQPGNAQSAIEGGLKFCNESHNSGMLKARFYLKLAGHSIREGNYLMANDFATTGLRHNATHHNNKLKPRLYVRLAIAQNGQSSFLEAINSAQTGFNCISGSTFEARLKARLLTQKAYAYNKLSDFQHARAAAEQAMNFISARMTSAGRDANIQLEDQNLVQQHSAAQVANASQASFLEIANRLSGGILGPSNAPYDRRTSLMLMQRQLAKVEHDYATARLSSGGNVSSQQRPSADREDDQARRHSSTADTSQKSRGIKREAETPAAQPTKQAKKENA